MRAGLLRAATRRAKGSRVWQVPGVPHAVTYVLGDPLRVGWDRTISLPDRNAFKGDQWILKRQDASRWRDDTRLSVLRLLAHCGRVYEPEAFTDFVKRKTRRSTWVVCKRTARALAHYGKDAAFLTQKKFDRLRAEWRRTLKVRPVKEVTR